MIPMVDLQIQDKVLKEEIRQALEAVVASTSFILGPQVRAFEAEAARYLGVRHAISCASGTDALHLALRAAGIGPGDEVITTPFTFIATAEAICYVGARPVFVDIDPGSFNMDPQQVEAAINRHTRVILPVHLFGQPADVLSLQRLCERHGLILIEDCAQSFGASVAGRMTGSFGLAGCFSFFPSKNLGCFGDGGMVTTHSEALAEKLLILRNHGSRERYYHAVLGYNSRLDELQAAVLRVKLRRIDDYNRARRRVAHRYNELLAGTPLLTPAEDGIGVHVFHQYTVLAEARQPIMEALARAGIASAIYYPVPLHRQEVFAPSCRDISLPVAERIATRCLSLPIFPELRLEDCARIAACIQEVLGC